MRERIIPGVEPVSGFKEEVDYLLEPYRDQEKTLLDYSCGFGFIANSQRENFKVRGFDTPEFADLGRELYGGIISSEPLIHSYDIVVSLEDTFEMIESYSHDLVLISADYDVPEGWKQVDEGDHFQVLQKEKEEIKLDSKSFSKYL